MFKAAFKTEIQNQAHSFFIPYFRQNVIIWNISICKNLIISSAYHLYHIYV